LNKFNVLSGKEVCKILEDNGFVQIRQKESHNNAKLLSDRTITVPVPNHREIKTGTLQSIIRQSELPKSFFQN